MNRSKLLVLGLVVLGLFLAQLLYTIHSFNQIRFEELGESVRSVYWLENHLVFSGLNAHLGWYTPLRIIYHFFGFSFEAPKYFRLAIHLLALISLTLLLIKIASFKKIIIPLIVIGLSPTLLFFNTLSVQYGLVLEYLLICLFLITSLKFNSTFRSYLPHVLLWSLAMIAWTSYPTFLIFLPSLVIYYIYLLKQNSKNYFRYLLISILAFFGTLALMVWQVQNLNVLIYDPVTKGGLFRGAAGLSPNLIDALSRIWQTLLALFGLSESYYYEVNQPEFSGFYPFLSIVAAIVILAAGFKKTIFKQSVVLVVIAGLSGLIGLGFSTDPSGSASVRRACGLIAFFYLVYIYAWFLILKYQLNRKVKIFAIFILLLLPLHHTLVYYPNYQHMADNSPYSERFWLGMGTPEQSVSKYVQISTHEDLKLVGRYPNIDNFAANYVWIYSVVAASCHWNNLNCHQIYGFDFQKHQLVLLDLNSVNYLAK